MNRCRNCTILVSSDGQRAKIPQNYRGRGPSFISVSFLADEEKRFNLTPANANNSVLAKNPSRSSVFWWAEPKSRLECWPATKNHQGLGNFENESNDRIFSVPIWLWNWSAIISTHPARTDAKAATARGNAGRVLVENNFDTKSVTWRSKFSAVLLQLLYLKLILDDSNLNHDGRLLGLFLLLGY